MFPSCDLLLGRQLPPWCGQLDHVDWSGPLCL